ncbi:hypothetical protein SAMN05444392_102249 [Seinonella peptonophila]|uniref:Uncharacterized protein n=1 Tax=Seinonella peptonophila TaxID=112248 RepID=A0A1M4V9U3_9BACL|nr:hypothetical protein [Seinonella peptonophila]SHE65647.1 hypothetical protein SAMN05444392_102249 [Seinonella peptonophila]
MDYKVWTAGPGYYFGYVEDQKVGKQLEKEFSLVGTYFDKKGKVCGKQFKFQADYKDRFITRIEKEKRP